MIKNEEKSIENKYQNVGDKTNRSDLIIPPNNDNKLNIDEEAKKKEKEKLIEEENKNIQLLKSQKNKGKPIYLEIKPYVLQNPQLQLYGNINNFSVCPFCKYTGTMNIEYEKSSLQKTWCCLLAVVGLFLCCWVPYVIRSLSNQVYKCNGCKKTLKTISNDQT